MKNPCLYKLNGKCCGKEYFEQACGIIREIFCNEKAQLEHALRVKKWAIESDYPDNHI